MLTEKLEALELPHVDVSSVTGSSRAARRAAQSERDAGVGVLGRQTHADTRSDAMRRVESGRRVWGLRPTQACCVMQPMSGSSINSCAHLAQPDLHLHHHLNESIPLRPVDP